MCVIWIQQPQETNTVAIFQKMKDDSNKERGLQRLLHGEGRWGDPLSISCAPEMWPEMVQCLC